MLILGDCWNLHIQNIINDHFMCSEISILWYLLDWLRLCNRGTDSRLVIFNATGLITIGFRFVIPAQQTHFKNNNQIKVIRWRTLFAKVNRYLIQNRCGCVDVCDPKWRNGRHPNRNRSGSGLAPIDSLHLVHDQVCSEQWRNLLEGEHIFKSFHKWQI